MPPPGREATRRMTNMSPGSPAARSRGVTRPASPPMAGSSTGRRCRAYGGAWPTTVGESVGAARPTCQGSRHRNEPTTARPPRRQARQPAPGSGLRRRPGSSPPSAPPQSGRDFPAITATKGPPGAAPGDGTKTRQARPRLPPPLQARSSHRRHPAGRPAHRKQRDERALPRGEPVPPGQVRARTTEGRQHDRFPVRLAPLAPLAPALSDSRAFGSHA
jgi:hypothetical protein